ncbi:hypothetical protein STEG23_014953, partial [Scotinomys teguina]
MLEMPELWDTLLKRAANGVEPAQERSVLQSTKLKEIGDLKSISTLDMEMQNLQFAQLAFGLALVQYFLTLPLSPYFGMVMLVSGYQSIHKVKNGFEDCGPDFHNGRVTAFLDIPGHDNLHLLTHLERHAFSNNVFSRQIVAKGLLDVFRDVSHGDEDILAVMEVAVRLSEDEEPTVRTELMEQIPPIVTFLQESRLDFPVVVSQYLVPVILRYLGDPDKQVRKFSQEVLLALLEQDLIFQCDIEGKVCPVLLERCAPACDDECRAEAVSVCATHFGDICHAVGQEATEKFL